MLNAKLLIIVCCMQPSTCYCAYGVGSIFTSATWRHDVCYTLASEKKSWR